MPDQTRPVPAAECPDPSVHGNPLRYCPFCDWIEETPAPPPEGRGALDAELEAEPDAARAELAATSCTDDRPCVRCLAGAEHETDAPRSRRKLERIARNLLSSRTFHSPAVLALEFIDAILTAGFCSPGRHIETIEELEALPIGSAIRTEQGHRRTWVRFAPGVWTNGPSCYLSKNVMRAGGAIVVLWEPRQEAGCG
ncbi:hypothetical protein AB0L97_32815 [Nocardia sp. NPDC051911]|uniref:hypothetical protein n=1 Tax=Nocardia sp. NPDC051911 TaxID=3154648 RepID=UPI0034369578